MSFDLVAIAPAEHSRRELCLSSWSWRPIAHLVGIVAPDIYSSSWMFNDYHEVDAAQAKRLAEILTMLRDDGGNNLIFEFKKWFMQATRVVGRPADYYFFEDAHIVDFINFLHTCGGFRIG